MTENTGTRSPPRFARLNRRSATTSTMGSSPAPARTPRRRPCSSRATRTYDVTGSLCENNDKFAIDRELPVVHPGDVVVLHDWRAPTVMS